MHCEQVIIQHWAARHKRVWFKGDSLFWRMYNNIAYFRVYIEIGVTCDNYFSNRQSLEGVKEIFVIVLDSFVRLSSDYERSMLLA